MNRSNWWKLFLKMHLMNIGWTSVSRFKSKLWPALCLQHPTPSWMLVLGSKSYLFLLETSYPLQQLSKTQNGNNWQWTFGNNWQWTKIYKFNPPIVLIMIRNSNDETTSLPKNINSSYSWPYRKQLVEEAKSKSRWYMEGQWTLLSLSKNKLELFLTLASIFLH